MIARQTVRFLDERFGTNRAARFMMTKIFPDHWSFFLGEFALYLFALLVMTGVWLTFVYQASPEGAYPSVVALSTAAPIGYLVRQVHHWSAVAFVAAILVHMARIFFTAAYRNPREVNWTIGVLMLVLASLAGFTGYSLPNDLLAGVGLRIADAVLLSMPFVGGWAADALNGGGFPGPLLLPHLDMIHVYFLPVAIAALLGLHLFLIVYQKHTQFVPDPTRVVGRRFWPDYALRMFAAFTFTVSVMFALAATIEINPIEANGPYNDWTVTNPSTPDWYAAFLDGALRLGPSWEPRIFGHPIPAVFLPGVVMPTIVLALVLAWPWIDAALRHSHEASDVLVPPTHAPGRVGVGAGMLAAGLFLTLAASDDQQAFGLHVPVEHLVTFYRILVPLGSIAVGLLATVFARELRKRTEARGTEAEREVTLRRTASGGFAEEEPQHV